MRGSRKGDIPDAMNSRMRDLMYLEGREVGKLILLHPPPFYPFFSPLPPHVLAMLRRDSALWLRERGRIVCDEYALLRGLVTRRILFFSWQ